MSQQHPDPINEGLQHGGQRLVQIVSTAMGVQQSLARYRQRLRAGRRAQDQRAQRAEAKAQRAAMTGARSRWERAHDRQWLRRANLLDVAEVWAAAVPYAPDNASAALAVSKCEDRLRDLHPHAMSHYDRYRSEGESPLDAMRRAAHFFARDPDIRTGDAASRRGELHEGTGAEWTASAPGPGRGDGEEARQEQRAGQIASELRNKLRLQGREPEPEELRTVLEIATNLPEHIIVKVVPESPRSHLSRGSDIASAAEDFPLSIQEALEMSSKRSPETPAARRTPLQAPDRNRRRNL
ncbi:hypothetical protein [Actinomadura livida]|uniref:Uncharacterized protein n=1 Tax=Actinomadura livida TaxID=79909 RepID=A0A7W7I7J5_9ACTN|nr:MULTISPECIES: hypothetical protein [Actinomadura]MBB4771883.1 hypothetical protein [Actinomadura catellatispora]GGU03105.1 hypothetical protein GCM10010208_29040 [Actinomadura livida]